MKVQIPKKHHSAVGRYINKWIVLLVVVMAIGGVFAFGLIAFIANILDESGTYNPLWMVFMIPAMFAIVLPIIIIIVNLIYKQIDVLSNAMSDLANGKKDVYIPIAKSSAFTVLYEDFNKMAAEIAGIQLLRNEIVDGFSHELKTPVASINGFAKLLLEETLPAEKCKKYLQIIAKESDRLAGLVHSNLLLSKIDTQEIITDKESYNLGKQIRDIAIAMETAWSKKEINLSVELPDVLYVGNASLMESLWQNLLSNAIKFTPQNGEISITLTKTRDNITVSFSDTGIGISTESQEHIFERYYQVSTSSVAQGYGLGLSIVKRIVRLCGGKITVKSKEGEGSTFTIQLPIDR